MHGSSVKLLLDADDQRISLPNGLHNTHWDLVEQCSFLGTSIRQFVSHNACPRVRSQFKRGARGKHMRPDLVDSDSTPTLERNANAAPHITVRVTALALSKTFDDTVTIRAYDQITQVRSSS